MLQVLSPAAPPTSSFEDSSSSSKSTTTTTITTATTTTDGLQGAAPGVTTSEYCDQLDIANFFLEMAAKRPFSSLRDEDLNIPSGKSSPVPRIRGGRIPLAPSDIALPPSLPPTPGFPPASLAQALVSPQEESESETQIQIQAPPKSEQQQQQPQQQQQQQQQFFPPPPSDVGLYERRPLPALPPKRHSSSSTLSRELDAAFATPHGSGAFFEGDDQAQSHQQQQEQSQHPGGDAPSVSDDMDWEEETEIRVVLDRPSEGNIKAHQLLGQNVGTDVRYRVSGSPIPDTNKTPKLTENPKAPTMRPLAPGASSTPSGHNSMHKIKQLMGVDVAPRESSSSEFLRRARWSHQDDDVFASDQDIDMSDRGCFLDSDDDSEMEDIPPAVVTAAPTSAPTRPNRFDVVDSSSRAESPVPAPLFVKKGHHRDLLYDVDDAAVARPSSSAGERRLGLGSHQQYSSASSIHYSQDLYHRTTAQLSGRASNTFKGSNWRNSGTTSSITGVSTTSQQRPPTRESHGSSSFGSGSQLIKSPIDPDKPLPSTPHTASAKIPDTPSTWTSTPSPGLPSGRTQTQTPTSSIPEPATSTPTPTPTPTSQSQTGSSNSNSSSGRKRATSTGAFGNIVGQRWQTWQQQHRQQAQLSPLHHLQEQQQQQQPPPPTSSPRQHKHPKVRIPYDPSIDPHPGIRIILPYELEEEEFPVTASPATAKRASIVSNLLKRISGSAITPTSPHGHSLGHKKRPSEPTTPTWLSGGGPGSGLGPGLALGPGITPTSSPIGLLPPAAPLRLDSLSLTPINKVVSPASAAAATIPISGPPSITSSLKATAPEPHLSLSLFPRPHSPRFPPQSQQGKTQTQAQASVLGSAAVVSPVINPIITKTTGFSILTEHQQQPQPQTFQFQFHNPQQQQQQQQQQQSQTLFQAQGGAATTNIGPSLQTGTGTGTGVGRTNRHQLPGNQRSSFSISEPPSPILSSLASLGHLNLSSGALGLGRPSSSKGERERERERERVRDREDSTISTTTKRSMSSLGFRSPPQLQLGPGLRAVADRSTLIAQRTNELVGVVGKRLVSLSKKDKTEKEKEKGESTREKDGKEKEKGVPEEKWREDMKSRIRVLDDGGRVLGMRMIMAAGAGNGPGPEIEIPLAMASPKFSPPPQALQVVSKGVHGLTGNTATGRVPPERPERSPIMPGVESFPPTGTTAGTGYFDSNQKEEEIPIQISDDQRPALANQGRGTSTESEDTTTTTTGKEALPTPTPTPTPGTPGFPPTGLRSPPPPPVIPPRSKARPISFHNNNQNQNPNTAGMSALASVGFGSSPGSGSGSGSRPGSRSGTGSRPGSSRGILREAFAVQGTGSGTGSGSVPGSRPGSARGNGNGSLRGVERGATEELETWV